MEQSSHNSQQFNESLMNEPDYNHLQRYPLRLVDTAVILVYQIKNRVHIQLFKVFLLCGIAVGHPVYYSKLNLESV